MTDETLNFNVGMDPKAMMDLAWSKAFDARMNALIAQSLAVRARLVSMEQNNLVALATFKDGSHCYYEHEFATVTNELEAIAKTISDLSVEAHTRLTDMKLEATLASQAERA